MTEPIQDLHAALIRVVQGLADEYDLYVTDFRVNWAPARMIGEHGPILESIEITTKAQP